MTVWWKNIWGYIQPQEIPLQLEFIFLNLLFFWACNISHSFFQTFWAMLLQPLFWACKEKDAEDGWITTAESSVLHDRAHNSCKFWSMASTTQEREEAFSGKMFFLVTLGSRNTHCGVALQRNPKTRYWQRQASCSWAFLPCNSTNQSIYTSFPCLPPHPCKYLRENTKSVSSRQRLERATGQLTMPIYIVSLPRITILQLALL